MALERTICLEDFEDSAKNNLPKHIFEYYADGDENLLRDCRDAFKRYRLRPRILRDVSIRDLRTTILGQPVNMPIGISPTAFQCFAHPEKERATALAAAGAGVIMGLSICSSIPIQDIAQLAPNGIHWAQMQFMKNPRIVQTMVRRAEMSDFKAILVTIDQPVIGKRKMEQFDQRPENKMVNFDLPGDHEVEQRKSEGDCMLLRYGASQTSSSKTWHDITSLKQSTVLPLVAKGITSAQAALKAIECGVDAIFVSAHGGRQLDGIRAPIDVLSEVVDAVKGKGVEVYMDGGVRTGTDVFKALALGAKAVFIGRPILWGLASNGEEGVSQVLKIIREELSTAMALAGCSTLDEIQRSMVVHEMEYMNSPL